MSYKKNQNKNINLRYDSFDNYASRLNDNVEDKLYTESSDSWIGYVMSGFAVQSTAPDGVLSFMHPAKVVDLGDGIARFKVRVMLLSDAYGAGILSPNGHITIDYTNEIRMQQQISNTTYAFTEDTSLKPQFGTKVLVEEYGTTAFIREMIARDQVELSFMASQGTLGAFNGGTPLGAGLPPITADVETGSPFIVKNVKYVSVPATNAARIASSLYNSAIAAGMTDRSRAWETTPIGRQWISDNIYDGLFPGKGKGAEHGPNLGIKGKESMWSSWFHNLCHKPYKKAFKGRGAYTYVSYPAEDAYNVKKQIEANPSQFIGQEFFCLFDVKDAPIFPGDSLFNWGSHRKKAGFVSYDSFEKSAEGVGKHMKVYARTEGTRGVFHGGNENQKVGNQKLEIVGGKLSPKSEKNKKKYVAVYKKVKVLGAA